MTMVPVNTLEGALRAWLDAEVERLGGSRAPIKPDHYRPFHWPPHPVSLDVHIPTSEWHGSARVSAAGQSWPVKIARTPWGIFGRIESLHVEGRGSDEENMLRDLVQNLRPLLKRQAEVGEVLGLSKPYLGSLRALEPLDQLKLFFSGDRSIVHDAANELETRGQLTRFGAPLIEILREDRHPYRRSAQWQALDLFEDLPTYFETPELMSAAILAIEGLMQDAQDDFARTVFKAGVVLGGQVCTEESADAVLRLIRAPSRIGRRSAMHASFHLCEWLPHRRPEVIAALQNAGKRDPEPALRSYADALTLDVLREVVDHVAEPIFPDEP